MRIGKSSIIFLLECLPLVFLLFICCYPRKTEEVILPSIDENQMIKTFDQWQAIGEGTDFLTAKIDLAQTLSPEYRIHALILDKDKYPLRKVSGYTFNPQLKGRNHLWFYFFLYIPERRFQFSNESEYLKFIVVRQNHIVMEKEIEHQKTWGNKEKAKIFDFPSPPDQIAGYLVLSDYTFLAKGDFRKPEGYYVEGKIEGSDGQWTHFVALSDIKGKEDEPEYILPADQGWLELATGRTHSMQEAISPSPPYVKGWWDGKGYFHPKPIKVYGLKQK
jgi:hypothetical protein